MKTSLISFHACTLKTLLFRGVGSSYKIVPQPLTMLKNKNVTDYDSNALFKFFT